MGATDPVELTHRFAQSAADPDKAQIDAQLALIAAKLEEHNDLFKSFLRTGDLAIKDQLIRSRMLHDEVVGVLQLVAQASDSGLKILESARVASTGNLALTGTQTIDGVACIAGDRILAKDQTDTAERGVYVCAAGAWSRATDADSWDDVQHSFIWVRQGTANEGTAWAADLDDGGTIDLDPVGFQLLYQKTRTLGELDPSTLPIAAPVIGADYAVIYDASGGALARVLLSAMPWLASTTTHGDLAGLGDDDHPQYVTKDGDTMEGALDMDDNVLTGLPDPDGSEDSDAVNVAYLEQRLAEVAEIPAGICAWTAAATAPTGWLIRNGAAISRTDYAALFTAIGTTYGTGDGTNTFNLPDDRGRFTLSAGAGTGLTARLLNATGGVETVTLDLTQIPAHTHSLNIFSDTGSGASGDGGGASSTGATGSAGGGLAHDNMPPYRALTPIIKY